MVNPGLYREYEDLYQCKNNTGGYIVVETIGTFVPFVLLVVSILSLVNIAAVQARVHNALTQAANNISMYCYTLEILGIANELTTLDSKASRVIEAADSVKNDISSILLGFDSMSGAGARGVMNRVFGSGEEAAGDPKKVLQQIMYYGINELRAAAFEELLRPLIGRYLGNGEISGDEYLITAGVVNRITGARGLDALEFHRFGSLGLKGSALIDKDGNVRINVEYEILYRFGSLPLPFSPTLRVTQTVVTKAWLNGSGKGYW